MEFDDDQGGHTIYGAIFMANRETKRECLMRNLFGLPPPQINFVKKVKLGMILFLFEYEERKLYGVFRASSDGASNLEPNAFKSSGKQFPAQISFESVWQCTPLRERDFGDAIRDNYYTPNKFNLGLSKAQVSALLRLFAPRRIGLGPDRSILDSDSSSGHNNHPFSNRQSSLTSGELHTNSSAVCLDMKVSPQGFVAYPSSLADDSLPFPGDQGSVLRFGSLDEKSNLGEYIPLEDDPYRSTSPDPGKDPPYVPEFVPPIPIGLHSDIPDRISVFSRLKGRLTIRQTDNILDDYISQDIGSGYEDALLTTEEVECNDVVVEEPPVSFKRRNKSRPIQDDMATKESNSLSGNLTRKRRKISRPSFVCEGPNEKGHSAINVEVLSCQEITEFNEKGTSETSVDSNGGKESKIFSVQTMFHTAYGEGNEKEPLENEKEPPENEKEPSENIVVQNTVDNVYSEHNIDESKFESGTVGGEANEKEPTSVRLVTEISENKDGSNNAEIERLSNSQDFKARVEELVQELKSVQGSSANEQGATQNTQ